MASLVLIAVAIWYVALLLNLHHANTYGGLGFFWTAALGIGPFVCLALDALLADAYVHANRAHRRLFLASLTAGLSPWIWWPVAMLFGLN